MPLNYSLSIEDAADISQQTFISLLENLHRLRPDSNLKAWLATVARRHALHCLRRRKRDHIGREEDIRECSERLAMPADGLAVDLERIQSLIMG